MDATGRPRLGVKLVRIVLEQRRNRRPKPATSQEAFPVPAAVVLCFGPVDDHADMSQRLSTLYLPQQANRRVTTLGLEPNLERLEALADPAAELDSDERRRCAT